MKINIRSMVLSFLTLTVFISGSFAFANRAVEVEEFYQAKVNEVLETRFPQTPFSVFVTVDTGKPETSRRDSHNQKESTPLPYWYDDNEEKLDIWDRMDVPLGTLIKQVRSISVSVTVDATLSDKELDELKDNLSKHLKLDPLADRIEITRMNWTAQERYRTVSWIAAGIVAVLGLLFAVTYFVSRVAINRLISGLSQPIAEIGTSTQKFANQALNMATDLGNASRAKERDVPAPDRNEFPTEINLVEIREAALELLNRNMNLFEQPDAEFMDFLERKGSQDPVTLGSILAELKQDGLRNLFKFGVGVWWYKAIAQPAPLTGLSLALLGEIDRLRVRRHFLRTESIGRKEYRESVLILHRVEREKMVDLLQGAPIEKVGPILGLLPREQGYGIAKMLYPGQWAVFLSHETPKDWKFDPNFLKELEKRTLEIHPLRENEEISTFFGDLDLMNFLDAASPRDERDFYRVLPRSSRVVKERFPFYSVIDAEDKQLKIVSGLFTPHEWAIALGSCDPADRRQVLEKFPDRLKFQILELFKGRSFSKWDDVEVRAIRRAVTHAFIQENERIQRELDSIINPTADSESADEAA